MEAFLWRGCKETGTPMKYPNGNPSSPAPPERGDPFFELASECPVEAWLQVLGHRWIALILYHLSLNPLRFSDLQAALPTLSAKVLADRLSELSRRELVIAADSGQSRRYVLTSKGVALIPILHAIEQWSRDYPIASAPCIGQIRF